MLLFPISTRIPHSTRNSRPAAQNPRPAAGNRQPAAFRFLAAIALAALLFGCSGSSASGEPDNFRNIKWGADVSSLSGSSRIAGEGDLAFYAKENDSLQVDGLNVDQVIYGFHKNRFYTAMIYFPGSSFNRMKEIMTAKLGEPGMPDKTPSKLVWDGSTVTVLLTSSGDSETARLAYLYKPVQLEIELKK